MWHPGGLKGKVVGVKINELKLKWTKILEKSLKSGELLESGNTGMLTCPKLETRDGTSPKLQQLCSVSIFRIGELA